MRTFPESLESICLTYVVGVSPQVLGDLVGARPLDLNVYTPFSDGITYSHWSEDPRIALINRWGRGSLLSEPSGGSQGARPETLDRLAKAGYEALSVCFYGREIPGWGRWRHMVAFVCDGHLALAFSQARSSTNRFGRAPEALSHHLRDLSWEADGKGAAVVLLERFGGAELSDHVVWGGPEPEGHFLIVEPPLPLDENELSVFLSPPPSRA